MLVNIFGGITRCDLVAQGVLEALERVDADGADRRAAGRHERRGGPRILEEAAHPRIVAAATMLEAAERGRRPRARRGGRDGDPGRTRHEGRGRRASPAREGTFHSLRNRAYGTRGRRRRHARQGRPGRRGHPGVRHGRRRGRGDRREHVADLRAGAVRRRGDPTRPPTPRSRSSSASPRASRSATWRTSRSYLRGDATDARRPELSRRDLAGSANVGIIPGEICAPGPRRARQPLRHAHVPDRARAHAARASGSPRASGWAATRCTASGSSSRSRVRGRRRDRPRRDDRRDRRRRRGARGRVHRRGDDEAGRRLHRRVHGAAGQADGPRRRDHHRLERAPRRPRPRRSRPPACRSGARRPRSPSWSRRPWDDLGEGRAPARPGRVRRWSRSRAQLTPTVIDLFGGGLAFSTARTLGWFYTLAFHKVAFVVANTGGGRSPPCRSRSSPGPRSRCGCCTAADGRPRASPVHRRGSAPLAGALVAPAYAMPIGVVTARRPTSSSASEPVACSRRRCGSTGSSGRRSCSRSSIAAVGRRRRGSPHGGDRLAAIRAWLVGGWRMLLTALGLALIGLLLLAALRPQGLRTYVHAVATNGDRVAALLLGHHALLLPNQSFWSWCRRWARAYRSAARMRPCRCSVPGRLPLLGDHGGGRDRRRVERRTGARRVVRCLPPTGCSCSSRAAATVVGGRWAAGSASGAERWIRGAGAGVVFGALVAIGIWASAIGAAVGDVRSVPRGDGDARARVGGGGGSGGRAGCRWVRRGRACGPRASRRARPPCSGSRAA